VRQRERKTEEPAAEPVGRHAEDIVVSTLDEMARAPRSAGSRDSRAVHRQQEAPDNTFDTDDFKVALMKKFDVPDWFAEDVVKGIKMFCEEVNGESK
jgi:hypothetical protein